VIRAYVLTALLMMIAAAPAQAVLVYQRPKTREIVVAKDNGSKRKVIAHGIAPAVSPDGEMVAFLTRNLDLRVGELGSGGSRLLARDVFAPDRSAAIAWSPSSEYLATGSPSNAMMIVNVSRGEKRVVPLGDVPGRGSFSPDSSQILVEVVHPRSTDLAIVPVLAGQGRQLHGEGPAWGPDGFAYRTPLEGIRFQRTRSSKPATLRSQGHAEPRDWSEDGDTLLAAGGTAPDQRQALLINRKTRRTRLLPQRFTAIENLSRNGRVVLAEAGGNVIAARRDGSTKVLARNATTPSWTK
jgi:hypothetical protein